ncbi:MAG: ABC transporter substrate-binding protein [Lachnospiraceae bacterium]|nr:ABC transporter substrate-binding protein [Lachnospiraceae bacterium]
MDLKRRWESPYRLLLERICHLFAYIIYGSNSSCWCSNIYFTVEFEPHATSLEQKGEGYVVASLGEDSGYVPYTSFSAKKSYLEENADTVQAFTDALQKGMDYVQNHTPEEIAQAISPQFPETDMETLTTIVDRYYQQDTWKENLIFEEDAFELLQNILQDAGVLERRVPYEDLVTKDFARKAAE